MKIETLKDRIAKAEERIIKKENTITKKTAQLEKKQAQLEKTVDKTERYWIECDIGWIEEDLKRLPKEVEEIKKTLENYRKQLTGEIERQKTLTVEVPESLKSLQNELITEWDRFDLARREQMRKDFKELDYHEALNKYRGSDMSIRYKTDEEIHTSNVNAAEGIILNLINRVKGITGEITDWSGITVRPGNGGWSVLNGYVRGKEGRCQVESIGAGGYNIQRYHIRVLVKPIN